MSKDRIIIGLEVGTSKICVAVGESHADGSVMVLGIGQSVSDGVRKGEIVDVEAAREAIHAAVVEAEKSSGVEIHGVYAALTGGHIRSFNNRGMLPILNDDKVITPEDVENTIKSGSALSLPLDHATLHIVKQAFYVDGNTGVENPVGMLGSRLEVDVHVIHGVNTRLKNTVKAIKSVPLEVHNIVFSPLAASLAALTAQQKELGVVLIDIGGGTTEFIAYVGGTIRHSGVIGVGGDHISNDLAVGLKIPINRAELLKIEHGAVPVDDSMKGKAVPLKREVGLSARDISKETLCRIIELRSEEIFTLVRKSLEREQLVECFSAGASVIGGCARTRGIQQLAERALGMPVVIGSSETVSGVKSALESPECATAIGLVRYGALMEAKQQPRRRFTERLAGMLRIF